jgi:hypothetical protein
MRSQPVGSLPLYLSPITFLMAGRELPERCRCRKHQGKSTTQPQVCCELLEIRYQQAALIRIIQLNIESRPTVQPDARYCSKHQLMVMNQPLQEAHPPAPTVCCQLARSTPANLQKGATNQIKASRVGQRVCRRWEEWKKRSICCARCSAYRPFDKPLSCCNYLLASALAIKHPADL